MRTWRNLRWTGAVLCVSLSAALPLFSVSASAQEKTMASVSKAQIEAAASRRTVFGHQSVGNNILEGVRKIAREQGVAINIAEGRSDTSGKPGIYHFAVGANGDPRGKISDFGKTLGASSFDKVDVALVKLCYVDFNASTDALAVALNYVATLKKLQETHPATRFVAVTAPLTVVRSGAKEWLKSAVGRSSPDLAENAKRAIFNTYLRKQFDADHLFDIAKLEAGPASTGTESLRPEISSDGGHLNDQGEREAGAAFIQLIAGSNYTTGQKP
jgi:hypothetical protein